MRFWLMSGAAIGLAAPALAQLPVPPQPLSPPSYPAPLQAPTPLQAPAPSQAPTALQPATPALTTEPRKLPPEIGTRPLFPSDAGRVAPGIRPSEPMFPQASQQGTDPNLPSPNPEEVLPQKEALARIDPATVCVRRDAGKWVVYSGRTLFRDFGESQAPADDLVRAVRELRPTEWGSIGTGRTVVEYGLTKGERFAPTYAPKTAVPVDPRTVRVESLRGVWVLRDDANILLNCGASKEDAAQALGVLRKYGFNRLGLVGTPGTGVTFFFAQPDSPKRAEAGPYAELALKAQEQALTRTGIALPAAPSAAKSAIPQSVIPTGTVGGSVVQTTADEFVGERISIDPRKVDVRREKGDWQLVHGTDVLARFGGSEWSARDALKLVQEQRFTEFCRAGGDLTFFLVNGQPPTRVPFAVQATRFDPESLKVRSAGATTWGVYDAAGRCVGTATSEAEAEQMKKVVQRFGFDQACRVGLASGNGLKYLAKAGR